MMRATNRKKDKGRENYSSLKITLLRANENKIHCYFCVANLALEFSTRLCISDVGV